MTVVGAGLPCSAQQRRRAPPLLARALFTIARYSRP